MPRFWRVLVRPARDGEAPGDQRPDVARPAGLHRQPREIDVAAFPDDFLARRRRSAPSAPCCSTCMNTRPRVLPRVLEALRRLGLLQEREQLADFAQRRDGFLAHPERDALRRAEQIAQHRDRVALRLARTAARDRPPSARDRRSRSSRGAGRPRRRCASTRPGARAGRGNRGDRRISCGRVAGARSTAGPRREYSAGNDCHFPMSFNGIARTLASSGSVFQGRRQRRAFRCEANSLPRRPAGHRRDAHRTRHGDHGGTNGSTARCSDS